MRAWSGLWTYMCDSSTRASRASSPMSSMSGRVSPRPLPAASAAGEILRLLLEAAQLVLELVGVLGLAGSDLAAARAGRAVVLVVELDAGLRELRRRGSSRPPDPRPAWASSRRQPAARPAPGGEAQASAATAARPRRERVRRIDIELPSRAVPAPTIPESGTGVNVTRWGSIPPRVLPPPPASPAPGA